METAQDFFKKGVDLQQRGLFDHAIEEYERALKLEPENIDILVNMGAACLQKGLSDRSIKLLSRALEKAPDNSMAVYNLGKALLYREDYETALGAFNRASELMPEDIDVKKSVASCLRMLGHHQHAADIMLDLIDSISSDFDSLLQLAESLEQIERHEESLDIFRKASSVACDSILPLLGIFRCQLALGNREKAVTTLKRAIMIEPANQGLLIKLIDMYLGDGRIQEAVDVVNKGLESIEDPKLLQEKFNEMTRRLPVLKKKADAAKLVSKTSPYETAVYDILDALYDGKIRLEVAVKELEALRSKDPSDVMMADELANLLFQARDFDRAAEIYSELHLSRPQETRHRIDLAKSLAMKGDSESARTILKDAIRDLGHIAELDLAMTELDLFDKDFAKAAARLEIILKEFPSELHAMFLYAYTALRLDELDTAAKTFEQLFASGAADEELAVWYSRLSIMQNKPEKALNIWENFSDGIESLVEIIARVELTLANGDGKSIMKILQRIGDYHPRFIEDHMLFGKAFFFAGDFSSAQREFDLVLRMEARNAEALAMSAMNSLIRNKSAKFWYYWQHAIDCDSLYAVLPAMLLKNSLNFSQKERLKAETKKILEIGSLSDVDRSRLSRLLQSL